MSYLEYNEGDRVLVGSVEAIVEVVYESFGDEYLALRLPNGFRQIWAATEVKPAPPKKTEDPVRREAVDLILEFRGVPREYLFEYPYNEHESRARIKEAEGLLDELLKVLEK